MTSLHDYSITLAQIRLNAEVIKRQWEFYDDFFIGFKDEVKRRYTKLRRGVPKWAQREFIRSKTDMTPALSEKSIFSDKDGNWGTLPLEVVMIIMTHHSRNNNRYWGSISFCNKRSHRLNRDFNPYKNIVILQPATYYEHRWGGHYPRDSTDEERESLRKEYKKLSDTPRTQYGKTRDKKVAVVSDIQSFGDIMRDRDSDYNLYKTLPASKMKCKYVKDELRESHQWKHLEEIASDGVSKKEFDKGWRICYYHVSKGYFTAKYGKIKENKAHLIVKTKLTKRDLNKFYKQPKPMEELWKKHKNTPAYKFV